MKFLFLFTLLACSLSAQVAARFDPVLLTVSVACRSGSSCPTYVVPGATIAVCSYPSCSGAVLTYTDAIAGTACPSSAPITQPGSSSCTATSNQQGQFGFWATSTLFMYKITAPNGTSYGPFPLTSITVTNGSSPTYAGLTVSTTGITSTNTGGYAYAIGPGSPSGLVGLYLNSNVVTAITSAAHSMDVSDSGGTCRLSAAAGMVCTGTQDVRASATPVFVGSNAVPVNVSALGTCNAGANGTYKAVNDALAPAWHVTVAGGGAVNTAVYCNGTNWIVI